MKLRKVLLPLFLIALLMLACACDETRKGVAETKGSDTAQSVENGANTPCEHSFGEWKTVKAATCRDEGVKERGCAKCPATEQQSIEKSEIHIEKSVPGRVATCAKDGLTDGKLCTVCNQILVEQTSIPKTEEHTSVTDAAVPATCKNTGLTEGSHCSVCNKVLVAQTTVPKTENHTPVTDAAVPATCKNTGLTEGSHCSVCDKVFVAQTVVPKTEDHSPVTDAAVPATCKSTGLTEGSHCSVCNKVLVAQTETPKSEDHIYVNGYCSCGLTVISEGLILQASEGLAFETVADGYALSGIGSCTDEFLIIPPMHNGKPVVEIADDALSDVRTFKKVFIPSTISKIGSRAFSYCTAMTEMVFGENSQLSTIGGHAFYNAGLVSIALPEGVETIESAAFHSCKNLKEITLPSTLETVGKSAFRYSSALSRVYIRDVGAWCQVSFTDKYANPAYMAKNLYSADGELITLLEIPEGVKAISSFAFYEVQSIKSVVFPKSLKKVSDYAFYGVGGVEMHIADLATWCSMEIKGASALPGGTLHWNGEEIVHLVIPDTVTAISAYVFSGISSIKTVVMHDNVTSIGTAAFKNCKNLEEITLSNKLTVLPKEVFYGNGKLNSVTIPETIVKIEEYAFYSCSSMLTVLIPNAVTYIGEYAFGECTALEEFVFECKQGWTVVYDTDTVTIYSGTLESSSETIKKIKYYGYGHWQRT